MKVGINIIYKTDLSNILFVHQQLHFLLNLEKFKFTLEYTLL